MNLKKSIGMEVYVVAGDESAKTDVEIHDNYTTMLEYLSLLNPEEHFSTKVYHGVLMPATVLPESLKGKSCFILALEMTYKKSVAVLEGYVFESDCDGDIDILATEIEQMIHTNEYTADMRIDIEDIFVLYGYELETCLSINPDSIDEEVVDTCKGISEELKALELGSGGD